MVKKIKKQKTLVLLDVHAILHRAYHAMPDFSSSKGEPTGALFGVITMLIKIIKDLSPDYIVACYDLQGPTFRHEVYKEYKAGRAKAQDDLVYQIKRSRDIFTAFSIPMYDSEGFEADDMLGTIVEQIKDNKDLNIIIASGDMDTLQLVNKKKVRVYTLKKGIHDTIIYDEKAVEARFGFLPALLIDYKGLRGDPSDNIIGIAGIGEKTATTLITQFGTIEKIYKTLHKDETKLLDVGIKPRIINLLKEGEDEALFSKTLATIRLDAPITFKLPEQVWDEEVDLDKLQELFVEFEFRTMMSRLKTVMGIGLQEETAKEREDIKPEELERALMLVWLLNSDITNPTIDDVYTSAGEKTFKASVEILLAKLKQLKLEDLYYNIELPIIPIIKAAEDYGIKIDVDYFNKISVEYHEKIDKLEEGILKDAGCKFNINSPKQLGEVLFDKMKLSVKGLKKTAGGSRSTRESELVKLKDEHEIINKILAYRELKKLLSTYIDSIPKLVDSHSRVHTNLNQMGTTTGRMSSSNPNMQNIPNTGDYGVAIRKGFIAPKGSVFLTFDYSQVEMRVLAHLSEDEKLIKIFNDGVDVHSSVAAHMFGVEESDVTKDMRRKAKVINFGIVYGMGVTALKENLGSTRKEAQEFYDEYFEKFPTIKEYFEKVKENAKKDGFTRTYFGRVRNFQNLKSPIPYIKAMAERTAVNAPIQGTAADIAKIAMKKADDAITKAHLGGDVKLVLQIHDELMYEVKKDIVDTVVPLIKESMEDSGNMSVPLEVHVGVGQTLGEIKEVK